MVFPRQRQPANGKDERVTSTRHLTRNTPSKVCSSYLFDIKGVCVGMLGCFSDETDPHVQSSHMDLFRLTLLLWRSSCLFLLFLFCLLLLRWGWFGSSSSRKRRRGFLGGRSCWFRPTFGGTDLLDAIGDCASKISRLPYATT